MRVNPERGTGGERGEKRGLQRRVWRVGAAFSPALWYHVHELSTKDTTCAVQKTPRVQYKRHHVCSTKSPAGSLQNTPEVQYRRPRKLSTKHPHPFLRPVQITLLVQYNPPPGHRVGGA
eukprot:960805-Rhodomonas_salina.1